MKRVDLVDDAPGASRIANALRDAGISTEERSVLDVIHDGLDGDLLILAGDGPRPFDAVRAVRETPRTAQRPIVMLGRPERGPLSQADLERVGADAYFPRPVDVPRLVERVLELLDAAPPPLVREPTIQLSQTGRVSVDPPREPTEHLDLDAEPQQVSEVREAPLRPSLVGPDEEKRESTAPGVVMLSARLRELLRAADRRLFPDEPPLELKLPIGGDTARELVSDELLEAVEAAIEPSVDDPLEAFTFIGPPPSHVATPLPALESERGRVDTEPPPPPAPGHSPTATDVPLTLARVQGKRGRTPAPAQTSVSLLVHTPTIDALDFGEPTADGRGRRGELNECQALLILWTLARRQLDVRVTFELGEGVRFTLTLHRGQVAAVDGPVATGAVSELRRAGRLTEQPETEAEAERVLARRVAAGLLTRLDVDRELGHARERLIEAAVASRGGTFHVRPIEDVAEPSRVTLVRGSLPRAVVAAARRRLGAERVRRLVRGDGTLSIGETAGQAMFEAGIEPEIAAAIERGEGLAVDDVLASVPSAEGLPGVLFALWAMGAVRLRPGAPERRRDDDREAVRLAVTAAHALAEDASYFAVLGVRADAEPAEIQAAYKGRRHHLASLAVEGPSELRDMRDEALAVVEEAFEILGDDRLRAAYRAALTPDL